MEEFDEDQLADLQNIIDKYIERNIAARLYSQNGGAKYDLANFCKYSDFSWLKDEIESDFNYIYEYIAEDIKEELDLEGKEEINFTDLIYDNFSSYLANEKFRLLSEVDTLRVESGLDKIYDHVVNEVENRFVKPEKALSKLIDTLIEKNVINQIEDIKNLESYKAAEAYIKQVRSN